MKINSSLISFAGELRKSLRSLGLAVLFTTTALFFAAPHTLLLLQNHLGQQLAFFTVSEPFLAMVKLAFFTTLFALMPGLLHVLWKALAVPFRMSNRAISLFVLFTCLLFYGGAAFCYLITLPFGVDFLLGFQSAQMRAVISVDRFVTFTAIFILAFGLIFELPVFMVFAARAGICPRQSFERNRRYAVLAIAIMAALLTPTPDVVNMLLMGGPLYLLYESGIFVLRLMGQP